MTELDPNNSTVRAACGWRQAARRWLLAFPLLAASGLAACRWLGGDARAPTWEGQGGELGRRVREGKVAGLAHHRFHSAVLGHDVGLVVATPPGYAARPEQRYPVVYIFPGIGGDEWAYPSGVGLDSGAIRALFANPDTAPIIVFGNPGDSAAFGPAEQVLADELVSFVDRTYRTRASAAGRSLEGFSLGGVTALRLLTRRPELFGRAVAASSACYLIKPCPVLRVELADAARSRRAGPVMLTVGARESSDNRALNEQLAPLFGVPLTVIPDADHDLAVQLMTRVAGRELGRQIAEFHLAGFAL